jgi:hypothetical protein
MLHLGCEVFFFFKNIDELMREVYNLGLGGGRIYDWVREVYSPGLGGWQDL